MNTLTSRILVFALVVLAGLNLFLLWTIWNQPEFRNSEYLIEEAIRPGAPRGDREERTNDRSGREMNRPFQRDQLEMQRRTEQFLRQRFGLTDEQSRQFTELRREHMRSAIETQRQINSSRQNLLLRVQDFAPSPNDVKDQQEMQRRAEQFLRQRFGLTDEQSRQFTQLRREHMRSAIETQGQINSIRQNLLLRVQDFAPSPNDVKDQQERLAQVDRAISELQKTEEYQELEQQLLELERRNLKHMVQLRALMNADQVKQFDVTMPRYLFRFQQGSGGPTGGPGVGPGEGGPDGRGPGGSPNRRPGS